jgi:hypothetical protein
MIQLPRYRHYYRNRRYQAIATTALSLLIATTLVPHCHHKITSAVATLPSMTTH